MVGTDLPILVAPWVKPVLRKHPAHDESIQRLTGTGLLVMDPDAVTVRADDGLATFIWSEITSALRDLNGDT